MGENKLRIVIWCGKAPNQKALANKIAKRFDLAGIVIDKGNPLRKKKNISKIIALLWDQFRFRRIYNAWKELMAYYDKEFPGWPNTEKLEVSGINSEATAAFTKQLQPDLIVVSGTGLIKEPLLSTPASIGIINLHTGLSPFVKGGPNCTNWCIANNEWELVGNTIMWLNAGIDAGNIITTESIDIRNEADLDSAHRRVMEHAHDLYLRAIDYLAARNTPYHSVPQQKIDRGNLYLTKMWTPAKRSALLKNWAKRETGKPLRPVRTVSLEKGMDP